jgi:hypothetical protein
VVRFHIGLWKPNKEIIGDINGKGRNRVCENIHSYGQRRT